jgi:hypothetical protein
MVRCVEYYEKCEKDGCDWCDKDPDTVRTIKRYIEFYKELETLGVPRDATIVGISEGAARPLFGICDERIRQKAIIKCSERLNPKQGAGRRNTKKLTEAKVKEILEEVEIELRNEMTEQIRAERIASGVQEESEEQTTTTEAISNDNIKETEEPTTSSEPEKPEEQLTDNTITRIEIQIYFNVMEKIGCSEDILKHKKRMDLMIENGTLRVVK